MISHRNSMTPSVNSILLKLLIPAHIQGHILDVVCVRDTFLKAVWLSNDYNYTFLSLSVNNEKTKFTCIICKRKYQKIPYSNPQLAHGRLKLQFIKAATPPDPFAASDGILFCYDQTINVLPYKSHYFSNVFHEY